MKATASAGTASSSSKTLVDAMAAVCVTDGKDAGPRAVPGAKLSAVSAVDDDEVLMDDEW
jgi:hypothetical protein